MEDYFGHTSVRGASVLPFCFVLLEVEIIIFFMIRVVYVGNILGFLSAIVYYLLYLMNGLCCNLGLLLQN